MATLVSGNPFPAEAVASYADDLPTSRLPSMDPAEEALQRYLRAYPLVDARYGGAIAIAGEFGSGKTHLLSWLHDQTLALRSLPSAVLYAKADVTSLFALYEEFIRAIKRPRLLELRTLALKAFAIERANETRATESVVPRIEASADLTSLSEEGNVDAELAAQTLEERLAGAGASPAFVAATRAIALPQVGEVAYRWLAGDDTIDTNVLGLTHTLRQDGGNSDSAGLSGIAYLATLHRLAGIPLVLLLDQLEVLVPPMSGARLRSAGSYLKKLIEQVQRADAFLIMAGAPDVWTRLPADVVDRLTSRNLVRMGKLSAGESLALLAAYHTGTSPGFTEESVRVLQELAGGSPRELLRMAHQAFEQSGGHIETLTREALIKSAESSGTIDERMKSAMLRTIEVFRERGRLVRDVAIGEGVTVDFGLERDGRLEAALELMPARTRSGEARAAKRISTILARLSTAYPGVRLIVVPIGYASGELAEVISREALVVPYRESAYTPPAESVYAALLEEALDSTTTEAQEANPPPNVTARLDNLRKAINVVDLAREREAQIVTNAFERNLMPLQEERRRERAGKTRIELLDDIDRLTEALRDGDRESERQLVKALLIANELGPNDEFAAVAGRMYLDLLMRDSALPRVDNESTLASETRNLRYRLLGSMRLRLLHPSAGSENMVRRLGFLVAGFVVSAIVLSSGAYLLTHPAFSDPVDAGLFSIIGGIGLGALGSILCAILWNSPTLDERVFGDVQRYLGHTDSGDSARWTRARRWFQLEFLGVGFLVFAGILWGIWNIGQARSVRPSPRASAVPRSPSPQSTVTVSFSPTPMRTLTPSVAAHLPLTQKITNKFGLAISAMQRTSSLQPAVALVSDDGVFEHCSVTNPGHDSIGGTCETKPFRSYDETLGAYVQLANELNTLKGLPITWNAGAPSYEVELPVSTTSSRAMLATVTVTPDKNTKRVDVAIRVEPVPSPPPRKKGG